MSSDEINEGVSANTIREIERPNGSDTSPSELCMAEIVARSSL